MGSVIYDKSMSLDGYIAGANMSVEAGLGHDGERLHDWAFKDPAGMEGLLSRWTRGPLAAGRRSSEGVNGDSGVWRQRIEGWWTVCLRGRRRFST